MMKFYLEPKVHKVEIAFESVGPRYNQNARVKIARVMIKGTEKGGAVECKSCEEGSIANSKLYMCKKCEKGFQPNEKQSECVPCPFGSYNPFKSGLCLPCPDFSYSSYDGTYCQLHDELVVNKTLKFHTHFLQPYELCAMSQNYDYCTDTDIMGPIFASPSMPAS